MPKPLRRALGLRRRGERAEHRLDLLERLGTEVQQMIVMAAHDALIADHARIRDKRNHALGFLVVEVGAGELPLEGGGDLLVAAAKRE